LKWGQEWLKNAGFPLTLGMAADSPHERGLLRVMMFGTAIAFGILAVIVVSMKDFAGGNAAFHFSYVSMIAFPVGFTVGWLFWRLILRLSERGKK
jgi:hypothetical protein